MSLFLLLFLAASPDGATTMVNAAAPAKNEDPSEKKICKRIPVSGTLAGYQRICRTKAEWQQPAASKRTPATQEASREGAGNKVDTD
jgi:hypothetical protein